MSVFFVAGDSLTHSILSVTPDYSEAILQAGHIGTLIGDDMVSVISFSDWIDKITDHSYVDAAFLEPAHDLNNGNARLNWSFERCEAADTLIKQNMEAAGSKQVLFTSRYDDTEITNPAISPCGRFEVTPLLQYGLDYVDWFNRLK